MKNFTIGRLSVNNSNRTFLLLSIWCIVHVSAIQFARAKSTRTARQSGADLISQAGIDLQQSAQDIPEVPPSETQRILPPKLSWMAFVENSKRPTNRHRTRSGGGRKKTGTLPMPPGPQGLQGPPGPPGPPGANVTKEVLLTEFRNMVREAAEKKIELALGQGDQLSSNSTVLDDLDGKQPNGPYIPLFDVDVSAILPKVTAGFFSRLVYTVIVGRKSLRELTDFHVPFGDGAFQRGDNSSILTDGRYTAPRNGIYHFIINLHFTQKRKNKPKSRKGTLHALLCIESLCQTNIALESIISGDQIGERFSLSVTGLLELKKGQYVSVIVDNDTNNAVRVLPNSYFSAILAGL